MLTLLSKTNRNVMKIIEDKHSNSEQQPVLNQAGEFFPAKPKNQ